MLFGLYGCIIRGDSSPVPQAISPYNGEVRHMDPVYKQDDLYTLNFNWTFPTTISTNLQYEFYYSDASSNLVIPVKTVYSRSTSHQINLSEGKTYYWKVIAVDKNTGKKYLPTAYSWKFTIEFKK
jgi:hypothetical protein